ncbi:MAG: hypothetical protein EOM12_16515 [Verrucomicrobiae bacterium]|nr:hypothetical protein [Verrucomicrobiae bacterium]
MANEITAFIPLFEDAIFQKFDPIRVIAKQDNVGAGAKTVSIPVSGGITFANITAADHDYPRQAKTRSDVAQTYDLTQIEVDPFRIGRWEEFVQNANLRQSIINELGGVLGAYATRVIFNGFWGTASGYDYATTGTTTYANRHGFGTAKNLTIYDVAKLANMLDRQGVPRDGDRYLVLDPDMMMGFLLGLAAIGYEDTATQAFRTGQLPVIHGFNIVQMHEVAVATATNAAVVAPGATVVNTHVNCGFALHKNFVGFAASNLDLILNPSDPEYYGAVVSGAFYAGGKYRRATPVGCITVYEGA